MLAKVRSCALIGLEAQIVDVEVDVTMGLERMTLVGLPDAAVRESAERVRAALANSGYAFPKHRLTVNLAPADLRKEGPAYDLPIAVGVLIASGQAADAIDDALLLGELSLDGGVRHVNGVLPMASMARRLGFAPRLCAHGGRCRGRPGGRGDGLCDRFAGRAHAPPQWPRPTGAGGVQPSI